MARTVTELDFRMPEFRDAKVEDYEFRPDGKLVRKDRWETAVQSIRSIMGISARSFEIPEVVDAVRAMADSASSWIDMTDDIDDQPEGDMVIEVTIEGGSILRNVRYSPNQKQWLWLGRELPLPIVAWREQKINPQEEQE